MSQPVDEPTGVQLPGADRSLIDGLVPETWPTDLVTRLDVWQTGDLLTRPALTWAGLAGFDPVTGTPAEDDDAYDWQPIADRDFTAPYGMLVSQTCAVIATGAGAKHPFVEIAPVFRRNDLDKGARKDIQQFKIMYQIALTRPPEDGFWVADLRLIMPISKALLVAHGQLSGFTTPKDLLNLAEALARKRRRPALHDALSEDLPRSLDDYVKEQSKVRPPSPPGWLEKVEQVRLRVTDGDRLQPTEAQLWVVHTTALDAEEMQVWRGWHARGARLLKDSSIILKATQYASLDTMPARAYQESVPVTVSALGRPPTW